MPSPVLEVMRRRSREEGYKKLLLGEVHAHSRTGHIVVRVADPNMRLRLGLRVVNSNGVEVGRLADIIGNVEQPYAVVKPLSEKLPGEGERLFVIIPVRKARRGTRRGGRKRKEKKTRGGERRVSSGKGGPRARRRRRR